MLFKGFQKLEQAKIYQFQVKNIEKFAFSDLKNLIELELESNLIREVKDTFKALISLERLTLSDNKIESKNSINEIEDGLFRELSRLKSLDLG